MKYQNEYIFIEIVRNKSCYNCKKKLIFIDFSISLKNHDIIYIFQLIETEFKSSAYLLSYKRYNSMYCNGYEIFFHHFKLLIGFQNLKKVGENFFKDIEELINKQKGDFRNGITKKERDYL